MLIVQIKDGEPIEKALKKFKRKFEKRICEAICNLHLLYY